jgi:hypothetical protein
MNAMIRIVLFSVTLVGVSAAGGLGLSAAHSRYTESDLSFGTEYLPLSARSDSATMPPAPETGTPSRLVLATKSLGGTGTPLVWPQPEPTAAPSSVDVAMAFTESGEQLAPSMGLAGGSEGWDDRPRPVRKPKPQPTYLIGVFR